MFYQICFSTQVKRIMIISNKNGIYELLQEFPKDVRLKILGNYEILRRSQIFVELSPSSQSSCQTENLVNTCKIVQIVQKSKFKFSRIALFHTDTKVCPIYFGKDCLWKVGPGLFF